MTLFRTTLALLAGAAAAAAGAAAALCLLAALREGLARMCVRRRLLSATGAALLAFALALLPTVAKRAGTAGGTPPSAPRAGTAAVPDGTAPDTLRFAAVEVGTNGTATLTLAWPPDLFGAGETLDLFCATSLAGSAWAWTCAHTVAAGETGWTVAAPLPGAAPAAFFRASHRETSACTMADADADGLPDAYELANGTNPYVPDYAAAPRLTVGPAGAFADIATALAASAPYSVVELDPAARHEAPAGLGLRMPPHPVMVAAAPGSLAVVRATGSAAFLLDAGTDGRTLFRGLYLLLDARGGLQAGFWCGGGLPWEGPGAAAVFENVHIRAPNPGVEYFGWLLYGPCAAAARLRGCSVNAAGADWIYGLFGDNPPPIVVESCTFMNFPPQSPRQSAAVGLRATRAAGAAAATPPVSMARVLFDASFTSAWPLARFENASSRVAMAGCILPSAPAAPDFSPDLQEDVLATNSPATRRPTSTAPTRSSRTRTSTASRTVRSWPRGRTPRTPRTSASPASCGCRTPTCTGKGKTE